MIAGSFKTKHLARTAFLIILFAWAFTPAGHGPIEDFEIPQDRLDAAMLGAFALDLLLSVAVVHDGSWCGRNRTAGSR